MKPRRNDERGFALLVVFLLSAAVAFTLYSQLPRVAFESAREREQLLMDRGNQYKRAIQVYYAVNKRYPAKIEDLENTNNVRFLRRRYKNPFTGKDEWRMVHTNGSFLTDSLVEKPPAQNAQNGVLAGAGPLGANNLNTPGLNATGGVNPTDPNANPQNPQAPAPLNAAARARPGDRAFTQGAPGAFAGQPNPGQPVENGGNFGNSGLNNPGFSAGNYNPNDPSTWPPISLTPTAAQNGQLPQGRGINNNFQNGQNIQLNPAGAFGGQPQFNGNQPQTFSPPFQSQPIQAGTDPQNQPGGIPGQAPGFGGQNPQPLNLTNANPNPDNAFAQASIQAFNQGASQTPNQNANQQAPFPGNLPSLPPNGGNQALALIGAQLSNPAPSQNNAGVTPQGVAGSIPGGLNLQGAPGQVAPGAAPANGTSGGPGIAGVASLYEGPSIKSYRERLKYQEWEFVYQPSQGGQTGAVPQQPNPLGNGAGGQTPTPNPFAPTASGAPGTVAPVNPFAP